MNIKYILSNINIYIYFILKIGNALNPILNGISSLFYPNFYWFAPVFNNNTIPNYFPPIVNPISPSVSNIFKTIQQN